MILDTTHISKMSSLTVNISNIQPYYSSDSDSDEEIEDSYLNTNIEYDKLTEIISNLCVEVMSEMGPHHPEGVYQSCLQYELTQKGFISIREVTNGLTYKGLPIGDNQNVREDLYLPQHNCLLELKAAKLSDKEEGQLKKYLIKNTNRHWGMCINFRTKDCGRNSVEIVRMIKKKKTFIYKGKTYPTIQRDPIVILEDLYPDNSLIYNETPKQIQTNDDNSKQIDCKPKENSKVICNCGKLCSVNQDGTIRHHYVDGKKTNGICPHVGMKPVDAS